MDERIARVLGPYTRVTMNREAALVAWEAKLRSKVPLGAAPDLARWIVDLQVDFRITAPRNSKLGDFRPAFQGKPARITVNRDLNPYHFLITSIHEFAHLGCYLKHGNRVAPHGNEWKALYVKLLSPLLEGSTIPADLKIALRKHLARPSASSCSCSVLANALSAYDQNPGVSLIQIPQGSQFIFRGEVYELVGKRRTRFLCKRQAGGGLFLITGRARVEMARSEAS